MHGQTPRPLEFASYCDRASRSIVECPLRLTGRDQTLVIKLCVKETDGKRGRAEEVEEQRKRREEGREEREERRDGEG